MDEGNAGMDERKDGMTGGTSAWTGENAGMDGRTPAWTSATGLAPNAGARGSPPLIPHYSLLSLPIPSLFSTRPHLRASFAL